MFFWEKGILLLVDSPSRVSFSMGNSQKALKSATQTANHPRCCSNLAGGCFQLRIGGVLLLYFTCHLDTFLFSPKKDGFIYFRQFKWKTKESILWLQYFYTRDKADPNHTKKINFRYGFLSIVQSEWGKYLGKGSPNVRADRQDGSSLHGFSSSELMAWKKSVQLAEDTWKSPILLPQPEICGKFSVNYFCLLRIIWFLWFCTAFPREVI